MSSLSSFPWLQEAVRTGSGFGRVGQIVGRWPLSLGCTMLAHRPRHIQSRLSLSLDFVKCLFETVGLTNRGGEGPASTAAQKDDGRLGVGARRVHAGQPEPGKRWVSSEAPRPGGSGVAGPGPGQSVSQLAKGVPGRGQTRRPVRSGVAANVSRPASWVTPRNGSLLMRRFPSRSR